jgi:2-iminobutanoate/2-iminopropanoate deaminase
MPIDPLTNEYVRGDIIKQAQRVLENLRIVLGTLDCDFHDVVSARVFLTNMHNFETVNRVYAAYFDEDLPARTCVAVTS